MGGAAAAFFIVPLIKEQFCIKIIKVFFRRGRGMTLGMSAALAAVFIGAGLYCRRSPRLRNTSRSMLLFGILMAAYSVLTLIMTLRG